MPARGMRSPHAGGSERNTRKRLLRPAGSIAGKRGAVASRAHGKRKGPQCRSPGPRPVGGFLDPVPDPPRTCGKNRRAMVVGVELPQTPVERRTRAFRAGAPAKRPQLITLHGKMGFFLKKRQYARLVEARNRLHVEVRNLKARLKRKFARKSESQRVALASLLLIDGVSATKIPHVVSSVLMYALDKVPKQLVFSSATALRDVRTAGFAMKSRLVERVCMTSPMPFFVGFDTSGRGGHLGAFVVSFAKEGQPCHEFFGFDRPSGSTASDFLVSLLSVVSQLQNGGAVFGGFSTDAPNVMVGDDGGLGALVLEQYPSARHDTCEHHASARLLAVLDSIWPPVMNVPSVSQFLYLTWYILNEDWDLHRARMLQFLDLPGPRSDVQAVLARFKSRDDAKDHVKKPLKPNKLRWATLAGIVKFVPLFLEALRFTFNQERVNAGANVQPCSVASMCVQWIKWSGSRRLRVLLDVATEFVSEIWEPANREIDLRDWDYDVDSCFKTFSRPRRTLKLLMKIEEFVLDPTSSKSYNSVIATFGVDRRVEVDQLFRHLFVLAHESVVRNSGRYLSGIYLFSGFADPNFAPVVFEAFAHWREKPDAPLVRTEAGKRLEKALKEAKDVCSDLLEVLLGDSSWRRIGELVRVLVEQSKEQFLKLILTADAENPDDFALFTLKSWLPALSHTRPVEKVFLDWDNQTQVGEGGTKARAAEASGKPVAPVTREAKVTVANMVHQIQRKLIAKRKPEKKRARIEAIDDFIESVALEFKSFSFSEKELKAARVKSSDALEYFRTPQKGGISGEICDVLEALSAGVDGWKQSKLTLPALLKLGDDLDISLVPKCSATCRKLSKPSKKGSPGLTVPCQKCLRVYHLKCMEADGLVAPGMKQVDLLTFSFVCALCGGSLNMNCKNQQPVAQVLHVEGEDGSSKAVAKSKKRYRKK